MKKKENKGKKVLCVTVEREQERNLKRLAKYAGRNVSAVLRELLPTAEEISAFTTYQDFVDSLGDPKPQNVFEGMKSTFQIFFTLAMSGHCQFPIGLQVAAVSYFDPTGRELAKLFKNWILALQSKDGCSFEKQRIKPPNKPAAFYYICVGPDQTKKKVMDLIGRYNIEAPDKEVLETIRRSVWEVKPAKKVKRQKKS